MRNFLRSYLRHHWFFNLVQLAAVVCIAYWWQHLPVPGYCIGVLAVLAAVMSVHGEMRSWQKAVWMLLIGAFLFLEFRAIDKDRAIAAGEQAAARKEQLKNFGEIAKGIDATISKSDRQFDATMSRIGTTLKTSEQTLRNTQPFAALEFQAMTPYAPSFPITVNHQIEFNVSFTNSGNDVARNTQRDAKIYVRRLDNTEDQKEIADDFNGWWRNSTHGGSTEIRPRSPTFFSFKSHPLTSNEVKELFARTVTLYVLIRFTWSDRTGHWIGDECFSLQDPTHDLVVGHPCKFHNSARYRAN